MRIIPAIDIINGKCVRLSKGDYKTSKIYNHNPVEVARLFEDNGIKYLHLVDLDGARSSKIINHKILEEIAKSTNLKIDFGGGIKSNNDIRIAFESGASQVTGGSIASNNPALFQEWLNRFGSDKIILGADCKDRKIMTHGWTSGSDIDIIDYILEYKGKGIKSIICTDIEKDGMLEGPSFDLYMEILEKTGPGLIASGGISTLEDIDRLKEIGCEAAIIGKSIYEGKINISKLGELC